jgi:acyl-CoA reductase-like NAD-dependent aldehyde dehydrogenase
MEDETDSVPAFVSELIRAANEIERVPMQERGALLRRAAITIRQFEGEFGELGDSSPVKDIVDASLLPKVIHNEEVRDTLLHAAEMIRLQYMAEQAKSPTADES